MLREIKFYARDILRGPFAKTPVAALVSGVLAGFLAWALFNLVVLGILEVSGRF